MSHVPYELIARRVEGGVQGDGELHHAQARSDVATGTRAYVDEARADLVGEGEEFPPTERPHVRRRLNAFEYCHDQTGRSSSNCL